jgi:hypothetical protein
MYIVMIIPNRMPGEKPAGQFVHGDGVPSTFAGYFKASQ